MAISVSSTRYWTIQHTHHHDLFIIYERSSQVSQSGKNGITWNIITTPTAINKNYLYVYIIYLIDYNCLEGPFGIIFHLSRICYHLAGTVQQPTGSESEGLGIRAHGPRGNKTHRRIRRGRRPKEIYSTRICIREVGWGGVGA